MRKFNEQKQLNSHVQKWHSTEYTCKYCNISPGGKAVKFTEKFEYIKHLNSAHSVKFNFECNHCKKNFKYLSHYIEHRRCHLISSNSSLLVPTAEFSSNQDKPAENCVEMTSANYDNDSNSLNSENIDSTVEEKINKVFKCEECGKKFSKNFNLKRHINFKHGKNNQNSSINRPSTGSDNDAPKIESSRRVSKGEAGASKIGTRHIFDCNMNQKKMYSTCRMNHHLNRVNLN